MLADKIVSLHFTSSGVGLMKSFVKAIYGNDI